ncbi:MAG TPA: hypothetical protein VNA88_01410 [Candidatus Kapabacteria bacterium]|nr:hypothetical protein [Candidatus Kapabacteria bacterium]
MELKLKRVEAQGEEGEFDGRNTAFVVGAILLAATFWASPSMGILFAIALIVCAAVCAVVLLIAGAIGFCDSAASRIWTREREVKMPSRAMSA